MTELQFLGSCGRAAGLAVYPWLPTSRVAAPLTTTPASSIPPVKQILGQQRKQYLSNLSNCVRLPVSSEVKSHLRLLQGRCRTQRKLSSPIFFHSPAVCSSICFKRQDSVLLWSIQGTTFYHREPKLLGTWASPQEMLNAELLPSLKSVNIPDESLAMPCEGREHSCLFWKQKNWRADRSSKQTIWVSKAGCHV